MLVLPVLRQNCWNLQFAGTIFSIFSLFGLVKKIDFIK